MAGPFGFEAGKFEVMSRPIANDGLPASSRVRQYRNNSASRWIQLPRAD